MANYTYPTFNEIATCYNSLAQAYIDKYVFALGNFNAGPGGGDVGAALAAARQKGNVPPADQPIVVDAFMALIANFGGDTESIMREHNGWSSVSYQILYGVPPMTPTPKQKFELDPAKVLANIQAGTNAVGQPVTQDALIAGAKFYGKVYKETRNSVAARVLKSGIKDDLVQYFCLSGVWHDVPSDYVGGGDPNFSNNQTPENDNLFGLDLSGWLQLQNLLN